MAKSARKRHVNDAKSEHSNGTKSSYNNNNGREVKQNGSNGVSCVKVCLLVVTFTTCALIGAYYLNDDVRSVIHNTLVLYGIPGFDSKQIKPLTTEENTSQPSKETQKKTTPSKSDKPVSNDKPSITNSADSKIRAELDEADHLRAKGQLEKAKEKFDSILKRYPKSPRAHYGKAETLDKLAGKQKSNTLLEEAIQMFSGVLDLPEVPDDLVVKSAKRGAERMNFRGWSMKAAKLLARLNERFPGKVELLNELGVAYLMTNKIESARKTFQMALDVNPKDGFALVHMGFIYKTTDNDPAKAIPVLREGVQTRAPGTVDGRFYFHLGDALQRVGEKKQAYQIYEDGANLGLFLSMFQRSLYNVDRLIGRPWWTVEQTGYKKHMKLLENNWKLIRDEGLAQMDPKTGSFLPEEENLRETGDWKQFTLYQRGRKNEVNCKKTPRTCALIDQIPAAKGCTRGQVKYSVMQPGVHVWPHCGPTNCRIRAHLGLVVPEGPRIRVGEEEGTWEEGKFIIFDDSFEHEVWHDGDSVRLVLIVDFWHPDLTDREKAQLSPI